MSDRAGAEVAPFTNAAREDVLEARIAKLEQVVHDLVRALAPGTCNSDKTAAIESAVASMAVGE